MDKKLSPLLSEECHIVIVVFLKSLLQEKDAEVEEEQEGGKGFVWKNYSYLRCKPD